jgi:biotin-(acetyl-CoA carboxylase) ligase
LSDSGDWRVRKGPSLRRFSDRLVVQGRRAGLLDLSVCLLAGGQTSHGMLGLLGPLAAASTSEGIRRDTGIVSWLHWPNLVTIDDRVVAKTSFSHAELPGSGGKTQVVMSVSVNCFSPYGPAGFPSALPSTSILQVLGVEIDVALLRDKVLHAVNWYYSEWERGMHRKITERMLPTIAWLGRDVEVSVAKGPPMRGRAKGLDDFGSLLLEREGRKGGKTTSAIPPESVEFVQVAR